MKRIVSVVTEKDEPLEQAKTYLIGLFGHIEDGYVVFSGYGPKEPGGEAEWQGVIHTADLKAPNSLIDAAEAAIRMSTERELDVYVATTVMGVPSRRTR